MAWRFDPLDRFPVGEGPFRARGLAYTSALKYLEKRLPGGRPAFNAALGADPTRGFYDQLFLAIADYDIGPLLRLYKIVAAIEGTPIDRFIAERAAWSGGADTKGVWKRPLSGDSIAEVAERLQFAFNRYFPPCQANVRKATATSFEGELTRLPACMNGLYVQSTVGFYRGALEGAGAREVRVDFERPITDGLHAGVPVERVRFVVTWP